MPGTFFFKRFARQRGERGLPRSRLFSGDGGLREPRAGFPGKPIRVLSVIHPFRPDFSGAGEWWLRLIPLLRARGVQVEILTSGTWEQGAAKEEVVDSVSVRRVPIRGGRSSYWERLRKVIGEMVARRRTFDVALFISPNHDILYAGCAIGRIMGWKTVYRMSLFRCDDLGSISRTGRLGRLRLAALRLADGYISISRVMTRGFENARFLRNKHISIPNGVDTARFRPSDPVRKRFLRQELGISEDARVALFCGAVVYRKGVDILVDAWRSVSAKDKRAILLVVGPTHRDGLEEPEYRRFSEGIERRIKTLGLDASVRLLGFQSAPENYYAVADVFVLPSRWEGWGNVVTEAMASGLPCVVSLLDGISEEHLWDGEEGVIVRSESPEEYAAQILRLFADEETRRRMGQRARKRTEEVFDAERTADTYAAFLHRICGNKISA